MLRCVYVPLVRVLLHACSFVVPEALQNEAESNIFTRCLHIHPEYLKDKFVLLIF